MALGGGSARWWERDEAGRGSARDGDALLEGGWPYEGGAGRGCVDDEAQRLAHGSLVEHDRDGRSHNPQQQHTTGTRTLRIGRARGSGVDGWRRCGASFWRDGASARLSVSQSAQVQVAALSICGGSWEMEERSLSAASSSSARQILISASAEAVFSSLAVRGDWDGCTADGGILVIRFISVPIVGRHNARRPHRCCLGRLPLVVGCVAWCVAWFVHRSNRCPTLHRGWLGMLLPDFSTTADPARSLPACIGAWIGGAAHVTVLSVHRTSLVAARSE